MAFFSVRGWGREEDSDEGESEPRKDVNYKEFFDIQVDEKGKVNPPSPAMKLMRQYGALDGEELVEFSIIDPLDPDKAAVQLKLNTPGGLTAEEDRALGSVLGMVVGDALGAPLEFNHVQYDKQFITGMDVATPHFGLKPGQWTDDASMGLCMADSLLVSGGFNAADMKHRFLLWWNCGYCNAFRADRRRRSRHSVGLGGNISMSFDEFLRNGEPYTAAGDKNTSGNGSIMRLAPVPVFFHDNYDDALKYSALSSLTTHQGDEAAECCRLMAHLIVNAIHKGDGTKKLLNDKIEFTSPLKSVTCLTNSEQEEPAKDTDPADRDWNWRHPAHRYAPTRARKQPGYIGSYSMDALCMALHCVHSTNSFAEAVLKAANMCGDSDSVASVTGQIAGAIYGASAIPKDWLQKVNQWDNGGEIALKAYKLFHHQKVDPFPKRPTDSQ
jgi:ADP-ribosylglycohydrolase